MAVAVGCGMLVYREMGLVSQVLDEAALLGDQGRLVIGRTRDSVTGGGENLSARSTPTSPVRGSW